MIFKMLKEFTRGGQMTMHGLRMIFQAFKYVIQATLILSVFIYVVGFFKFTAPYDRYIASEYIMHKFIFNTNSGHYFKNIVIKQPNNSTQTLMVGKFLYSEQVKQSIKACQHAVKVTTLTTIGSAMLLFFLLSQIFMVRSRKLSGFNLLRGSSLVPPKVLAKRIISEKLNSSFTLAGVPLIRDSETQHLLFTGTVGTGKSVALTELLDQVRQKKQKAIVYDCDGTYISSYYRPFKDLILNPLDQRSPAWNIWQECEDSADFEAFAESLMPLHLSNSDPFWINAARTIFATAAFALKQQEKNPTTRKLLSILLTESLDSIADLLKNTAAESLVSEKIEKVALSVKATLSTHCKSLLYLKDETEVPELFSIRKWIKDDGDDNWLFIATNKEKAPALRPLISAWLDVAVRAVLSLPRSFDRRLWFFMDELPSLYQIPSLKEVLAEGRKFGACFVATIQDIHQLRAIYNREAAEALLSLFNTKLCFRTGSTESAEWAERAMGLQEVLEIREGYSYGANDIRDGVTLQQERRKTPIVMSSQFLDLNKLEAYLRLPGNVPITKLQFTIKKRPEISPAFLGRKITDISILEKGILQDQQKTVVNKPPELAQEKSTEQSSKISVKIKKTKVKKQDKLLEPSRRDDNY